MEDTEAGPIGQQRRLQFARQVGERLQDRLWLSPAAFSADAGTAQAAALAAAFSTLVRTAREAGVDTPLAPREQPWSAIEAALAKLGAAQSGLVSS